MSTVGYGDIAPKRRFSRFAAVIWMYVALVVPCILTASTSSLVFGLDTFDVEGKTVGVLNNSYESHIATDVYQTKNVYYDRYQDLMDGVRRGDVFAGLVNADVVTWYQNEKWKVCSLVSKGPKRLTHLSKGIIHKVRTQLGGSVKSVQVRTRGEGVRCTEYVRIKTISIVFFIKVCL